MKRLALDLLFAWGLIPWLCILGLWPFLLLGVLRALARMARKERT